MPYSFENPTDISGMLHMVLISKPRVKHMFVLLISCKNGNQEIKHF